MHILKHTHTDTLTNMISIIPRYSVNTYLKKIVHGFSYILHSKSSQIIKLHLSVKYYHLLNKFMYTYKQPQLSVFMKNTSHKIKSHFLKAKIC